jgi:hypothetical protein
MGLAGNGLKDALPMTFRDQSFASLGDAQGRWREKCREVLNGREPNRS